MATIRPLIVIVGPTASGKTSLAIDVAKKYDGEVICADSRTVFREMNVGTAKPSLEEQASVRHWGLDLTAPGERFTAAAFQAYATEAIADIRSRGKLPIIAGGTGLYIDGLIFDYRYPEEPTDDDRKMFEAMSTEELHKYCLDNDLELPFNDKNKRHLIRTALQAGAEQGRRDSLLPDTWVFGIVTEKAVLQERIRVRTEHMFEDGVVEEAKQLGKKYGWDSEAMTGNIYPLIHAYLKGECSEQEVVDTFMTRDWQLAKRQMTWFRRNPMIAWGNRGDILRRIDELFTAE